MKQKDDFHMNVGGASVMLVVVIFVLSVFSVLSLRASWHELQMAEKTCTSVMEYYQMDTKAEELYAIIGSYLKGTHLKSIEAANGAMDLIEDCYSPNYDKVLGILTYTISKDNKALEVKLQLSDYDAKDFTIYSWKLKSLTDATYDSNDIEIWDGNLDVE